MVVTITSASAPRLRAALAVTKQKMVIRVVPTDRVGKVFKPIFVS